jgi:GxxExxY protein
LTSELTENAVSKEIVDAAYRLHRGLGPGLLESVYETLLCRELQKRGLRVSNQHPIPVFYEGTRVEIGFRADLLVEDKVIVENQIHRGSRANSQETASNVSAPRKQTAGIVDQFQRGIDPGWNYSASQRIGRIISRKGRKGRKENQGDAKTPWSSWSSLRPLRPLREIVFPLSYT